MGTNELNENEMNFLKKIQNLKRTEQLELELPFGATAIIDIYYNELYFDLKEANTIFEMNYKPIKQNNYEDRTN